MYIFNNLIIIFLYQINVHFVVSIQSCFSVSIKFDPCQDLKI